MKTFRDHYPKDAFLGLIFPKKEAIDSDFFSIEDKIIDKCDTCHLKQEYETRINRPITEIIKPVYLDRYYIDAFGCLDLGTIEDINTFEGFKLDKLKTPILKTAQQDWFVKFMSKQLVLKNEK